MDRDQAAEIKERLLDIGQAIDRAAVAIWRLGEDEREASWPRVNELHMIVYDRLLAAIYAEHPELEPPPEPPQISSTLEWDEVSLPSSVSIAELDRIIFSVMQPQLRKMALMISHALKPCEKIGMPISDETIAARIQALAKMGHFESQGDLRMWRHSEIRLKQ